jgi:hypothetical protein
MLGTQHLLAQCEAALAQWLGLGVAALNLIQPGQVVQRRARRRGARDQRLLGDVEGAPVQRLGCAIAARVLIDERQPADGDAIFEVVLALALLGQHDVSLCNRNGLGVLALAV